MKRWTKRIALILILGIVAHVGLVWAAMFAFRHNGIRAVDSIDPTSASDEWPEFVPEEWDRPRGIWIDERFWSDRVNLSSTCRDDMDEIMQGTFKSKSRYAAITRYGWPFRSLTRSSATEFDETGVAWSSNTSAGMISLDSGLQIWPARVNSLGFTWVRRVPIRPIWDGFIFNSLISIAVFAVLGLTFIYARLQHRRKWGKCLLCGHYTGRINACEKCNAEPT